MLNMPGGQSDHPLSPYFGAGHADWVNGRATPLLPGPVQHTLMLEPAQRIERRLRGTCHRPSRLAC